MTDLDRWGYAAFIAWLVAIASGIAMGGVGLLLHLTWPRRLREAAVREPYFSPTELAVSSSFPISLWHTIAIAMLIARPQLTRKRFGDLDVRRLAGRPRVILSYFFLALLLLSGLGMGAMFASAAPLVLSGKIQFPPRIQVPVAICGVLILALVGYELRQRRISGRGKRHRPGRSAGPGQVRAQRRGKTRES